MKKRICFICHGNICRSPMAEYMFRELIAKRGVADRFTVCSRAVSDEEIVGGVGHPVYPPVRELLRRHGIDCSQKRAEQLTRQDYEAWDLLIGMDRSNLRRMHALWGGDPAGKCRLLRDFTDDPGDIADPWYSRNFALTWRQVTAGCEALLERLSDE